MVKEFHPSYRIKKEVKTYSVKNIEKKYKEIIKFKIKDEEELKLIIRDFTHMAGIVFYTDTISIIRHTLYGYEFIFDDKIYSLHEIEKGNHHTSSRIFVKFDSNSNIECLSFYNLSNNSLWPGMISWNKFKKITKITFNECYIPSRCEFFPSIKETFILLLPILLIAYIIGIYKPELTIQDRVEEIILNKCININEFKKEIKNFKKARLIVY